MAQKKKRRRKHRGTQAGTIERARGAEQRGRPRDRGEARQVAKQRRLERLDQPPTWRGSLNRAAIAAAVFGVVVILAFGQKIVAGVTLAAAMLFIYIPMSYFTDRFMYNRRQRKNAAARGG